jgi:hypothetical protein
MRGTVAKIEDGAKSGERRGMALRSFRPARRAKLTGVDGGVKIRG